MRGAPAPALVILALGACSPAPSIPPSRADGLAAMPSGAAQARPAPTTSAPAGPPPVTGLPSPCPCGGGQVCVPSRRVGEVCARACTRNTQFPRGEACDERWGACAPPRTLAPKLAACSLPAPPRRSFSAPVAVASRPGASEYAYGPTAALAVVDPAARPGPGARPGEPDVVVAYAIGGPLSQAHRVELATVRGGVPSTPQRVRADRENQLDPHLASGRDGLHLVWLGFDGLRPFVDGPSPSREQRMMVGYSTSRDGAQWSPAQAVHDAVADCPKLAAGCLDAPRLAVGPDRKRPREQNVYVMYSSEAGGGVKLVRSQSAGASFGSSADVARDGRGSVFVGADGVIHVAYVAFVKDEGRAADPFGDKANVVEYVRSEDAGLTFSTPVRVSDVDEELPRDLANVTVTYDDRRRALHVVYPVGGRDGRWDVVVSSSRDGGKSWARTHANDDAACANHALPMAVLDPRDATLHVAWVENRSGQGMWVYAPCDVGRAQPTCGANEAVSGPFAGYALARYSPRWLGDGGAIVLDEKARALHVLFTAPHDGRSQVFYARATLPARR